jgi:uncharacterized protein YggE
MNRIVSTLALALVSIAGVGCAHGGGGHGGHHGACHGRDATNGIFVVGEGKAEATPDVATFRVGVEVRRPTVAEARTGSAEAQQRVIDALHTAGIDDAHIQTEQLSVQPDYDYGEQGRTLRGYLATNAVRVRVTDLEKLPAAIDGTISAGGDDVRLDGVQFEVSDPARVQAEARTKAIEDARRKAEQIAASLGIALGDPVAVDEAGGGGVPGPVMMRMEARNADAATPVQAGTTEVRTEVRVRWSIRR